MSKPGLATFKGGGSNFYHPARKARREVANLTEKNPHTPFYKRIATLGHSDNS